jgi:Leucine-rich repeat (LRR) protein
MVATHPYIWLAIYTFPSGHYIWRKATVSRCDERKQTLRYAFHRPKTSQQVRNMEPAAILSTRISATITRYSEPRLNVLNIPPGTWRENMIWNYSEMSLASAVQQVLAIFKSLSKWLPTRNMAATVSTRATLNGVSICHISINRNVRVGSKW